MTTTAGVQAYLLPRVPVCQPSNLEGDPLYATEILPGPPSSASLHLALQKRDPKKPSTPSSYLPASDPGTTYSAMQGTLVGGQDVDSPRKRARFDKAATGRAQRASARNQNGATTSNSNTAQSATASTSNATLFNETNRPLVVDDERPLSTDSSSQNLLEDIAKTTNGRTNRRDKGKGKELDGLGVRVKEEPQTISLHTPEPSGYEILNEDKCSSCRSTGTLIYCDGCPRAFHLWCLNPPIETTEETDQWFCPVCARQKQPPTRHSRPTLFTPILQALENTIPTEYQLPEDIRTFFKDITTGPKGTYVDASETKPPRLNRHGQLEERDPHRLKDRAGAPVLCFRCGTSALPERPGTSAPPTKRARRATAKAAQYEVWKNIISCDYCDLHWHLDCLDPPLTAMPSFAKKWMCPNHAEQILTPKRRVPKQSSATIEVTKPKQFNNGNIEIIHPQSSVSHPEPKVPVEEVLINGRRYRIPERLILLDFWNALSANSARVDDAGSGMSSPLTSLTSLEDQEDLAPASKSDLNDMEVAQLLCGLRPSGTASASSAGRQMVDTAVQTVDILGNDASRARPSLRTSAKRATVRVTTPTHITRRAPSGANAMDSIATATSSITPKPKKTTRRDTTDPSNRELRSKNKSSELGIGKSISEEGSPWDSNLSSMSSASKPKIRIKLEEPDNGISLIDGLSNASSKTPSKRLRRSGHEDAASSSSRKRKEPDEDAAFTVPSVDRMMKDRPKEKRKMERRKVQSAPSDTKAVTPQTSEEAGLPASSTKAVSSEAPATPSLKIRLPPLNASTSPAVARNGIRNPS